MQEPRTAVQIDEARRRRAARHARRGVVAGYLHSLSDRHATVRREQPTKQATAPVRSA
jgi:hypothetical protein